MLFFYRFLIFSYIVNGLITLIPKLLAIIVYFFLVGIILIGVSDWNFDSVKYAFYHPGKTFSYLYHYGQWIWHNRETISIRNFTELIFALSIPYLSLIHGKRLLIYIVKGLKIFIKFYSKKALSKISEKVRNLIEKK